MKDVLFVVAAVVVFFAIPVLGVFAVARDVVKSRTRAREKEERDDLRQLADGLRDCLGILRAADADIAWFSASLASWLESYIAKVRTGPACVSARLLLDAEAVGLGEESRRVLRENAGHRNRVLVSIQELVRSLDKGMPESVLQDTGALFALFWCEEGRTDRNPEREFSDPGVKLGKSMRRLAWAVREDFATANEVIGEALEALSGQGYSRACGVPILILRWAQIRLWSVYGISHRTSRSFQGVLQDLARQFTRVAKSYAVGDLSRVAKIIYSHL